MKITVKVPPKVETMITGERGSLCVKQGKKEYIIQFYVLDGENYSHYKYFENGSHRQSDTCPTSIETAIFERATSLGWF